VASRPVSLAPRPPLLAGREELLAGLDARLSRAAAAGPRIIALHGLGGAGKTSVAVEYAHRHQAGCGVVWQFPAEDRAVLAGEFARLAAQLGVGGGLLDRRDPVASVHAVLAAAAEPWLLVFDNAPDRDSVRAFLPPAGDGLVLITSQSALWPPGQSVEVPVLDAGAAAGFLTARTGDPDERAAGELAAELGGLPLALEQAAAYVHATGDSLAGYLASFRQWRADLLGRGDPIGYNKTVASTWALAFDRLQRTEQGAVGLLRLLAFCAPEAVPLRLLLEPRPGLSESLDQQVQGALVALLQDPLAARDAIAALRRYSLVAQAGGGSVLVHRLVQAVTAGQVPAELAGAWRQAAAAMIEAAIPDDPTLPETWPVYAALLPHAQAALAETSDGMARIANYLGWSGSYAAAKDLQRRVADARERVLGSVHLDTLTARHNMAYWTREAGDLADARDLLAELLPISERELGPEHPRTLAVRGNLVRLIGQEGDAAGARDMCAALLKARERVLGPDHLHTLITRHELARWTGEAGDAAGARDLSAALLPVVERVLGPDHPDTLITRHELARWTGEAGDAAGARDLSAELLPVHERVFSRDHPDTLGSRRNVAVWTGEAGDAAAARDQLTELLPRYERVLGAEHPETLATRDLLARWTGEAGDAATARDQYAALLPVRERVQGLAHPRTLVTRADLAYWTGMAGDAASARDQYAALLPVLERVQGPEHPDTLSEHVNLVYWTEEAGDAAGGPGSGAK
jgi:hypothetical protein